MAPLPKRTRKEPKTRVVVVSKLCNSCGAVRIAADFHKNKLARDGLSYRCKTCAIAATAAWQAANPDRVAAHRLRADPEKKSASVKAAKAKKPELYRAHNRAAWAIWRARLLGQTITLTDEQRRQIRELYTEARRLTRATGVKYEVDHIIPLAGEGICGLHVPWNLQVITKAANLAKANKLLEAA